MISSDARDLIERASDEALQLLVNKPRGITEDCLSAVLEELDKREERRHQQCRVAVYENELNDDGRTFE